MPTLCVVRVLTAAEAPAVSRLAHGRPAAARRVERARLVWLSAQGRRVAAIAAAVRCSGQTVRTWVARCNAAGVDGLADAGRSGRPPTHTPGEIGAVVAAALSKPEELGLPFAGRALERLAAHLNEHAGIPIERSRIAEVLAAEGLRWRQQEGWFGARVDPDCAANRGRLQRPPPAHRPGAS